MAWCLDRVKGQKESNFSKHLLPIWWLHRPYGLKTPGTHLVSGGISLQPQGAFDTQRDLGGLIFSLVLL